MTLRIGNNLLVGVMVLVWGVAAPSWAEDGGASVVPDNLVSP